MNDFDSAMKKIADVFYSAARKSGEIIDNTKKSYNISAERDKIAKIQQQIGLKIYKTSLSGGATPDYVQPEIDAIKATEEKISELERSMAESKSAKICLECGARIAISDVYCPKCGAKQPDEQTQEPGDGNGNGDGNGDSSCGCGCGDANKEAGEQVDADKPADNKTADDEF